MGKLTRPQVALLAELAGGPRYVWESYAPLKALIARGYVEKKDGRKSDTYRATEAGRLALKEKDKTDV